MSRTLPFAPRALVHRGSVVATGVVIARGAAPVAARMEALAWLEPGGALFALPSSELVVRFAAPRRVFADTLPVAPLVALDGSLSSTLPLSTSERARLRNVAPNAAVVLGRHGEAHAFDEGELAPVDPAEWLGLDAFEPLTLCSLSAPPAPLEEAAPPRVDARAFFQIPPVDARSEVLREPATATDASPATDPATSSRVLRFAFAALVVVGALAALPALGMPLGALALALALAGVALALRRRRRTPTPTTTPVAQPARGSNTVVAIVLGLVVFSLLALAISAASVSPRVWIAWGAAAALLALARSKRAPSSAAPGHVAPRPSPVRPARPTPAPSLLARLRAWIAWRLPLTRRALLAERERYLLELLEAIQRDPERALRMAIPLGGDRASGTPDVALPGERDELVIRPRLEAGGSSALFPDGVYELLKRQYRSFFEQLDQVGAHERAAFVLAELLRDSDGAVAYLERQGLLREAALLAEGRELAPELVTRQWLVAGDVDAAVAAARRSSVAMVSVVERLERRDAARGAAFRLHVARWLAREGDALSAARVVLRREDVVSERRAWLQQAAELGGLGGAQALGLLIAVDPEGVAGVEPVLGALLADRSAMAAFARQACNVALSSEIPPRAKDLHPVTRRAQRALARAALLDGSRAHGDPLLTEDARLLADLGRPRSGASARSSLTARIDRSLRGPLPVRAVRRLSSGRLLVGLGEAGLVLTDADGRVRAHFRSPCASLSVASGEQRVVTIARRGDVVRLGLVDLATRREAPATELALRSVSAWFDGLSLWVVLAGEGDAAQLDLTVAPPMILRRLGRSEARIESIAWQPDGRLRARGAEVDLVLDGSPPVLRQTTPRAPIDLTAPRTLLEATLADGPVAVVAHGFECVVRGPHGERELRGALTLAAELRGDLLFVTRRPEGGRDVALLVLDAQTLATRAELTVEGVSEVVLVIDERGVVTTGDELGRVVVLDPRASTVRSFVAQLAN